MYINYEKISSEVKGIISKNFNVKIEDIADDRRINEFFSEPLFFIELADDFQKIEGMPSVKDGDWRKLESSTVRNIIEFVYCKINNNDEII